MITIYDSDEWVVARDEDGDLIITNFNEGHWNGAIHIDKDDTVWEE